MYKISKLLLKKPLFLKERLNFHLENIEKLQVLLEKEENEVMRYIKQLREEEMQQILQVDQPAH